MGKEPNKPELFLLFNRLGLEPTALHKFLLDHNETRYSLRCCQRYYTTYLIAEQIAQQILKNKK
jgi:hypothetical protein